MNGSGTPTDAKKAEAIPKKTRKSKVIKSGTFFRLDEKTIKAGVEIVMAMGIDSKSNGKEKGEEMWICAVVHPAADTHGAYELFVAKQKVIERKHLNEELTLEYNIHSRYYVGKGT